MTQEEAAAAFRKFEGKMKFNATRSTSIGDETPLPMPKRVDGRQLVDRFIQSHGFNEHRDFLNSLARASYNVDPEQWIKTAGP